ncbi:hypothetical protein B0J14DRAFT_570694 [Halenospora varia]|nr:hypothetical protein B0J14DRAFT_570694 [Halenospora varia]
MLHGINKLLEVLPKWGECAVSEWTSGWFNLLRSASLSFGEKSLNGEFGSSPAQKCQSADLSVDLGAHTLKCLSFSVTIQAWHAIELINQRSFQRVVPELQRPCAGWIATSQSVLVSQGGVPVCIPMVRLKQTLPLVDLAAFRVSQQERLRGEGEEGFNPLWGQRQENAWVGQEARRRKRPANGRCKETSVAFGQGAGLTLDSAMLTENLGHEVRRRRSRFVAQKLQIENTRTAAPIHHSCTSGMHQTEKCRGVHQCAAPAESVVWAGPVRCAGRHRFMETSGGLMEDCEERARRKLPESYLEVYRSRTGVFI